MCASWNLCPLHPYSCFPHTLLLPQGLCTSWLFATPWTVARQASLSITSSQSLLKLMSIESVMPSNHLILCCPLLLLPSIFTSIRVFSNESSLYIRWSKYWAFNFHISPSNKYSGLISFRIDWFDLLGPRDSQESSPAPQFETINSSVLSLLYGPALTPMHDYWKTIALTIQTFVKTTNGQTNLIVSTHLCSLPFKRRVHIQSKNEMLIWILLMRQSHCPKLTSPSISFSLLLKSLIYLFKIAKEKVSWG